MGGQHGAIQHNLPGAQLAMQRAVPQFHGANIGIGNEQFDMTDPRMMAGLGFLMGGPMGMALASSLVPYGAARQHEQNRYNKAVEKQYMPQADAASLQAQQLARFGGIGGGGLEQAYGNFAYNDVLKQIAQLQAAFKDKQNQAEAQGVSGLMTFAGGL